ncbi:MAG: sigma-54-dependent Fis family transcriptional regulator [Acidobacteria bacterium]|nr:sigma-54-dependent Fis family transcriptional regulator [Acidobacteriota bacterium]
MIARILVVDDKRDLARGVALVLSKLPAEIAVAYSAEEALELLERDPADVVLSDIRMPGRDGLSLLDCVRERWPQAHVILFTGYGTIDSAVDAMRRGAFHYLTKPFNNDELLVVTRRALSEIQDQQEIARLRAELRGTYDFHGIYSRDRHMQPVIEAIRRVAPTNATVLIWGESGTGKELVARAIHAESPRAGRPFVAFNAAAMPETLAEAELFGCKKGAYTGADRDRKGLFLEADGGTLLIDEVASMPLGLQGKLLRTLQEREVLPLGSATPIQVDARVIATTNEEVRRLLRENRLRRDLYYRLSVMRIAVPPLRQRIEDIPLLAELFLDRLTSPEKVAKRLSPGALRLLISHDWPGNVRELQNVVERAALMARGDEVSPIDIALEDDDLEWQPEGADSVPYEEAKRSAVERFQRRYIEHLIHEAEGNISAAARKANMTRAALHRILKRLGLAAEGEIEADGEPGEGHEEEPPRPEGPSDPLFSTK